MWRTSNWTRSLALCKINDKIIYYIKFVYFDEISVEIHTYFKTNGCDVTQRPNRRTSNDAQVVR